MWPLYTCFSSCLNDLKSNQYYSMQNFNVPKYHLCILQKHNMHRLYDSQVFVDRTVHYLPPPHPPFSQKFFHGPVHRHLWYGLFLDIVLSNNETISSRTNCRIHFSQNSFSDLKHQESVRRIVEGYQTTRSYC